MTLSSASSREAKPDCYRDIDAGLGHCGRKGRQRRVAHHLFDRRIDIGKALALSEGEIEDAAAAIDRETQDNMPLLTPLPRGIGVALVNFEPST